jgi:hypothetical protein
LQMAYTLLWSCIERYTGLRYHLGKKVNEKVYQIAEDEEEKEIFAQSLKNHLKTNANRVIHDASDPSVKYTLDPNNPQKSIRYYYQVRSNIIHRGKAVTKDFDRVKTSLEELLQIFKDLLKEAWKT